jgi:hypothetical protein
LANKKKDKYTNFSNVEVTQNYLFPEEFPEGPFGSPINRELGKSTEWQEDQRSYSAFNYENKTLHQDIPRQYPGAHPTHDDNTTETEKPYQDINQKS